MKLTTDNRQLTTKLILALDVDSYKKAIHLVKLLSVQIKIFKVGLQLYTACGPKIIQGIRKTGAKVFLDLKFNDIPNTMVKATKEVLKHKVDMFTVHTLAGPTALKEVAHICQGTKTKVLGVTILTSICGHFLRDLGIKRGLSQEVLYLARMAKRCHLDGVVCSVQEARLIRKELGKNFIIVSPGLRQNIVKGDDQMRIATVSEAIKSDSDFLVVGRPILEASDPLKAAKEIK